jgi:hypothetical protein
MAVECMQMAAECAQIVAECMQMVAECMQMVVECVQIGLSMESRQTAMDLHGRKLEGTLRVQNMLGGVIGSTEPCWR